MGSTRSCGTACAAGWPSARQGCARPWEQDSATSTTSPSSSPLRWAGQGNGRGSAPREAAGTAAGSSLLLRSQSRHQQLGGSVKGSVLRGNEVAGRGLAGLEFGQWLVCYTALQLGILWAAIRWTCSICQNQKNKNNPKPKEQSPNWTSFSFSF